MGKLNVGLVVLLTFVQLYGDTAGVAYTPGPEYDDRDLQAHVAREIGVDQSLVKQFFSYWKERDAFHVPTWRQWYGPVASLIRALDLDVGVEVGVAFGTQSAAILKHTKVKKLISIDPYESDLFNIILSQLSPEKRQYTRHYFDTLYHIVTKRLSAYGDRSSFIREPSPQAARHFKDGELDFVYVDGGHLYDDVRKDLNAWYPKIRFGGFLIGDDYNCVRDGVATVKKAVGEFVKQRGLALFVFDDRIFVIQKNPYWAYGKERVYLLQRSQQTQNKPAPATQKRV